MIATLERLTALEILFILLWLAIIVYGFKTGPVRQIFMIGSMLAGMLIGGAVAGPLSVWTGPMSGIGREGILPFTYAVLVILTALVLYILIIRSYPNTRMVRMPALDSVTGAIVGFFTGLLLVSQLAAMIELLTRGQWAILDAARVNVETQLTSGPFLPAVTETFPLLNDLIQRLMPHV